MQNKVDVSKASLRQRQPRCHLATTSLLPRGAIDNYTSHPRVIRQSCMSSNPQHETHGILRSEDGSETRLSIIANDLPDLITMDTIDSYLGDFLENDDEDQENNSKLQNMRSGVIFLVDCTPTMLGLTNNNDNNSSINSSGTTTSTPTTMTTESGFNLSLLCCQTFQQNKALHSPFDMIGLVLMRTVSGLFIIILKH
ncbi:unnamed protein product [Trichobilharzia regenti]|nr:unnamed protein product [Trichobilharzia regenti]